jgi:diguanylate cyclase (GGDEF)-like protein/PAS domain S-box-containing protein
MSVALIQRLPRPGTRAVVLVICAVLVAGAALAVSSSVADHLSATAIQQAARTTSSLVDGSVGSTVAQAVSGDPSASSAAGVDAALVRLVRGGDLLRIKVWSANGTVLYSDLPQLVGKHFAVDEDLADTFAGETSASIADASEPENVFERGLADHLLSVYLPIHGTDGKVVAAFETYQDAAPIEADVAAASRDVLGIVGVLGLTLLVLLAAAFAGTSRRIEQQNRSLRERAEVEAQLMRDLRQSDQRFQSLVQNSAEVQAIVGLDGTFLFESGAARRVLGRDAAEAGAGRLIDHASSPDAARILAVLAEAGAHEGAEMSLEYRARHADGSWRTVEAVIKNLLGDSAVRGLVVNYRDVSDQRQLERELRRKAFHDGLTGMPNRALLAERLGSALSRSEEAGPRPAVLFIDLDDFKTVNDSLGHGVGDRLLVEVARRLGAEMRTGDTLARMGGDEFAVLVEGVEDAELPVEIAHRLLDRLRTPFRHARREVFVRASVGVALAGAGSATVESLLRSADTAMYTAKTRGKDRVEVYEPAMHDAALRRLALKGELERAIDRSEFQLAYQPIVGLESGRVVGAEALLRWHHPDRGVLLPGEFVPLAEESGLIVRIGQWVLQQAVDDMAAWPRVADPVYVSVNVSPRQLVEPRFDRDVAEALEASGAAPGRLLLEFTESALIGDAAPVAATLHAMEHLGIRLGIDDFGTGFSSLSYLGRLPIDVLKIDRSFVAELGSEDGRAVVAAIVRLSEALGLDVIAEGIETEAQLQALRALGVGTGQGHLFARAMGSDELVAFVRDAHESAAVNRPARRPTELRTPRAVA